MLGASEGETPALRVRGAMLVEMCVVFEGKRSRVERARNSRRYRGPWLRSEFARQESETAGDVEGNGERQRVRREEEERDTVPTRKRKDAHRPGQQRGSALVTLGSLFALV